MNIQHFLKNPSPRPLLLLAAAFSAAMLAVALIGQYGFDLFPCKLCIYQRYPYLAIVLVGLGAAWLVKSPRMLFYALLLVGALFALDAGIAFYHAGVELGWFPGPGGCTNNPSSGQTIEEMLEEIRNAPLVSCDQAMIEVLGLSMAAWNAIAATLAAVGIFWLLARIRKAGA